ncbi:hypothetical protein RvY_01367 [Ramazzottius varieornatus]|uniref:UDP-glucuronosyltransferase n=1 Tax=Ramazzottius varieornatus TaxID=947166 RepID=A0A1D1URA1_RAMVA|nr:hypothetical protein RvY_01367 [Ramazzottius varieornatus]
MPALSEDPSRKMHVLVLTFPAFGHITPMLELSRKIAKYHHVTFAISQACYKDLLEKDMYSEADKKNIQLHIVEDDIDMKQADATEIHRSFAYIWDKTLTAVRQLLSSVPTPVGLPTSRDPVDVVVADIFVAEALHVCIERSIPYYLFVPGNTDFIKYCLLLKEDTPTTETMGTFMDPIGPDGQIQTVGTVFKSSFFPIRTAFPDCKGIVANSARELERKTIAECEKDPLLAGKPFYCVGPLLPEEKSISDKVASCSALEKWLDGKENVVFISFGSVASPIPPQVKEIGSSLIGMNQPFIWSLRKTHHGFLPEELKSAVENFDGKGVILPWVDQKLVLGHPSVEVFVSHCGWNSTLEGLSGGKPIVCWPMFGDQLVNAEFITSRGAGTIITDGGIGGKVVPAAKIADTIKATKEKSGETARMWGKEIRMALQPGGTTVEEFLDFISFSHEKS